MAQPGRLLRETNPLPGHEPGYLPQFEKQDGTFAVTGENNPLPTAGYGMTEGGIWIPRKVTDEGHDLTQLTGSNVVEETLLQREIRTEGVTFGGSISVPDRAFGVVVVHRVWGVTGTFDSGEGHRVFTWPYATGTGNPLFYDRDGRGNYYDLSYVTSSTGANSGYTVTLHPHIETGNEGFHYFFKVPMIKPNLRVSLQIEGTFEDGEGIDSAIYLYWLIN